VTLFILDEPSKIAYEVVELLLGHAGVAQINQVSKHVVLGKGEYHDRPLGVCQLQDRRISKLKMQLHCRVIKTAENLKSK
jgi:hypothetical protein